MLKKTLILLLFILIPLAAGWVSSSLVVNSQAGQYTSFIKPNFAPPGWLFAPVWSILYILMGVASYLVWNQRRAKPQVKSALILFLVQLILNILWSVVFFGWQRLDMAWLEITLLELLILATTVAYWRIRPAAGVLLVPYIVWVGFASMLNFSIWQLN